MTHPCPGHLPGHEQRDSKECDPKIEGPNNGLMELTCLRKITKERKRFVGKGFTVKTGHLSFVYTQNRRETLEPFKSLVSYSYIPFWFSGHTNTRLRTCPRLVVVNQSGRGCEKKRQGVVVGPRMLRSPVFLIGLLVTTDTLPAKRIRFLLLWTRAEA